LNHRLPYGYFAEPNVQFGIEIDVGEYVSSLPKNSLKWSPSAPTQTFPFQPVSEAVEISIFNNEEGPLLAGAIELVSPANKVPLWLRGSICLPIDLGATYELTCQEQRIKVS
jgi:hypothetical protein